MPSRVRIKTSLTLYPRRRRREEVARGGLATSASSRMAEPMTPSHALRTKDAEGSSFSSSPPRRPAPLSQVETEKAGPVHQARLFFVRSPPPGAFIPVEPEKADPFHQARRFFV